MADQLSPVIVVEPGGFVRVTIRACLCDQRDAEGVAVILVPPNVRVWIATGDTDMRSAIVGLAQQAQEAG